MTAHQGPIPSFSCIVHVLVATKLIETSCASSTWQVVKKSGKVESVGRL